MKTRTERRQTTNALPLASTPLARALYAERARRQLSLAGAAKAAGLSLATYHRLETTAAVPSVSVLLRAARWVEMEPGDLIDMRDA